MDRTKLRLNLEYGINIFIDALGFIAGVWVMILCIGGLELTNQGFSDIKDDSISIIFLGPFLLAFHLLIIAAGLLFGIVPILIAFTTGTLSTLARFRFTEKGTAVTKNYRKLMIAVYIVYGVVTTFVVTSGLTIFTMATLRQ